MCRICSGISFFFLVLILNATCSLATMWDEVRDDDYNWHSPDISTRANQTPIDCYSELGKNSIGQIFSLRLRAVDPETACIIKLPSHVEIQFLDLDFEKPETFVRLLSGNNRRKLSIISPKLTTETSKDFYGEWAMGCLYGYMVVRDGLLRDSVKFMIRPMSEDTFQVSEEMCSRIHPRKLRFRR